VSARVESAIIHLIALGIVACAAIVAAWVWYPYEPLLTFHEEHHGDPVQIRAGDMLVFRRHFVASRRVDVTVQREAIGADGVRYALTPIAQRYDPGEVVIPRGTPLPDLPPGRYTYTAEACYPVSPLQRLCQRAPDVPFEVLP